MLKTNQIKNIRGFHSADIRVIFCEKQTCWWSEHLKIPPTFTHVVSNNELRKPIKKFCQKATVSRELVQKVLVWSIKITIFVRGRHSKCNLLEIPSPPHGFFKCSWSFPWSRLYSYQKPKINL